jgi:hypothetical protein
MEVTKIRMKKLMSRERRTIHRRMSKKHKIGGNIQEGERKRKEKRK